MESEFLDVFSMLDTLFASEHNGEITPKFLKLVEDTKTDIVNGKRLNDNITVEQSLMIDKIFDDYIGSK